MRGDIPVVIPTVSPDRDSYRRDLLESLARQGFGTVIVEQHAADVERGSRGQGVTARRGIVRALAVDAPAVLVIEDDVWISRHLTPSCMRSIARHGDVVTLYLADVQRFWAPASEDGAPVRMVNQTHWYGGQAMVLPRSVAMHVAHLAEARMRALDWEIRDYLDRRRLPLYAAVPNLVQHRAPPSINPAPGNVSGRHYSASFR